MGQITEHPDGDEEETGKGGAAKEGKGRGEERRGEGEKGEGEGRDSGRTVGECHLSTLHDVALGAIMLMTFLVTSPHEIQTRARRLQL